MKFPKCTVIGLSLASVLFSGCMSGSANHANDELIDLAKPVQPVAVSNRQWTGVAVSKTGRVFVNYPRWSDYVTTSVAELKNGEAIPFPNEERNVWRPGVNPLKHFVCVQAMYVDDQDVLWILDPGNPKFAGVVKGAAKLQAVNLKHNKVVKTYRFSEPVIKSDSYLNDVRIDTKRGFAYITDSGNGALVVLDLKTGRARRLLDNHPSTHAEDIVLTIEGKEWLMADGSKPQVHADGIAYDSVNDRVYYQALTGRTMYWIPGAALRSGDLSDAQMAAEVRTVGPTGASDGLVFGADGKVYISALEKNAIVRTTPEGAMEIVAQDDLISWPDSFALTEAGELYFTTARIHQGDRPWSHYGLHKIDLTK